MPLRAHLTRYYLRRWAVPILVALPFFVGLMLAFNLQVTAKLINSIMGASYRWLLPLLASTLPENISQVLPMAAVLGGLMGTQHLSEGSELVASQGLGAGLGSLLRPWLILALLLGGFASINAHVFVPRAWAWNEQLRRAMEAEALSGKFKPGAKPHMPAQHPGRALWLSEGGELHVLDSNPDTAEHLVARRFKFFQSEEGKPSIILTMNDIRGAQLQKSSQSVLLLNMREQSIRFDLPQSPQLLPPTTLRVRPTSELPGIGTVDAWIELSRRITLPLAAVVLCLMGIAMGISHPRFRRGGALLRSLGVILGYFILMRLLENQYQAGRVTWKGALFLLPLIFGCLGLGLLCLRLRPHHANRKRAALERLLVSLTRMTWVRSSWVKGRLMLRELRLKRQESRRRNPPEGGSLQRSRRGLLTRWTSASFLRNWAGTLAVFLALSFMLDFATLAGDLSQNQVSSMVFLNYWVWNLPEFLAIILPISFLFGWVLTLSDASVTHEWVALRAGGVSLVQWMRAGLGVGLIVVAATFLLQAYAAPRAAVRADALYDVIKKRPTSARQEQPWLHLSSTGILWHLDGPSRWGFPLQTPESGAPILMRWRLGEPTSDQLAWGGMALEPGPHADALFPTEALRQHAKPHHIPTLDLIQWQRYAPEPDRAVMLWMRLLGWLAGPSLIFAALSFAFPPPRQGRGQALGFGLMVGLGYTGVQMIVSNAARSGEIPASWGVALPLVLLLGVGLARLPRLRT